MTFLVVALQSEARPLVDHFGLVGTDAPSPYRLYRNDRITLVVSGVGRLATAAATAYLFAHAGEPRNRPWINIGIGGHRTLEVGTAALAHKITDAATGRSWYPSLVFDPPVPTLEVVTVDHPESEFGLDALYDMEAAAFFATASRFAVVELTHVLKVVSDNSDSPATRLDAVAVSGFLARRLEAIAELIERCESLAEQLIGPRPDLSPWIGSRRMSVSQRRQLTDLLQRIAVVEGGAVRAEEFDGLGDSKALLARLDERLRANRAGF